MRRAVVWKKNGCPGSPSKAKNTREADSEDYVRSVKSTRKSKKCWSYFKEFTDNTSLHGLKYIGEGKRSVVEKLWWCIMFILSVAACSHLIYKIWNKWQQNPVIVSFAEKSTPVWQVPFPAVTVCSETKARQTVFNFTEMYHEYLNPANNLTEDMKKDFEVISLLCDKHLVRTGQNTTDKSSVDLLTRVAPEFNDMMILCQWKTTQENCTTLFTPILTDDGICYTFNMLSAEELFNEDELQKDYSYLNNSKQSQGWTLDEGYPKNVLLDTYPVRGTRSGKLAGLSIVLQAKNDDLDYICRGPVQGFKILLHTPSEIPRVSQQYFRAPLSQEVIATIKPSMMTTSEGLMSYEPKRRQCYFPSEKMLKYYKVYTQQNCELECLTNYTLQYCGCVSISMPRNTSTPICSSGRVSCMSDAEDRLLTREIKIGIEEYENADKGSKRRDIDEIASQCDCLPACTAITYDAEISQADYNWKKLFEAYKYASNLTVESNMARVVLFFKESQFITHRRSELYGQTDFLANCGGLLGLFLGFSFLSIVEIIYFFTLRLFCNIKMNIKERNVYKSSLRKHADNGFVEPDTLTGIK